MKEKILNSNKYKRYSFYFLTFVVIYVIAVTTVEGLLFFLDYNTGSDTSTTSGIGVIAFSVLFLPAIIIYGIRLLKIRYNIKNYKLYKGVITSIQTPEYLRSDSRYLVIKVIELGESLDAQVYKGQLYDQVATNLKVEIAYNPKNNDVIVLSVL